MKKDPLARKLAVILHAHVVGSTTLVQINETLAHERIQDVFRRFSQTIKFYGGIAREIRGDARLAGAKKGIHRNRKMIKHQGSGTTPETSVRHRCIDLC